MSLAHFQYELTIFITQDKLVWLSTEHILCGHPQSPRRRHRGSCPRDIDRFVHGWVVGFQGGVVVLPSAPTTQNNNLPFLTSHYQFISSFLFMN